MLKKLSNAKFVYKEEDEKAWIPSEREAYRFYPNPKKDRFGNYSGAYVQYNKKEFWNIKHLQQNNPIKLGQGVNTKTSYWWFQDEFFSESDNLDSTQVRALLLEKKEVKRRRIEKAMTLATMSESTPSDRYDSEGGRDIPREVKLNVWQRDRGKCVVCGSKKRLEFDHIIPLSLGGSNTERNIQLLCESCNRTKGTNVGFGRPSGTTSKQETHIVSKCRHCSQKLRVPKGKGEIRVTCPKCKAQFQMYT